MLSSVQSSYFYNEDSDSIFVCNVSSLSASVTYCNGTKTKTVQSVYPVVYRINKTTNQRSLVYPPTTATTFSSLTSQGALYTTTPIVSSDIDVTATTKPYITYNTTSSLYNISFLGKYTTEFSIFTYYFKDVSQQWFLVDSQVFLPSTKIYKSPTTFVDGKMSSKYYVGGILNRFNNTAHPVFKYRSPNPAVTPTINVDDDVLEFNVVNACPGTSNCTTPGLRTTLRYTGGFITQAASEPGFKTDNIIRVNFTSKAYFLDSQTTINSVTESSSLTGTRYYQYISQPIADKGEGFCLFFYEETDPDKNELIISNNNSGLGYAYTLNAEAEASSPTNIGVIPSTNQNAYLGIGFDITGNFCTTTDGKTGSINGTTYTTLASSIGIRGNDDNGNRVLGRSSQITTVPMLSVVSSASDASFIDWRVDLTENATRVLVYAKEEGNSTYNLLYSLRLTDIPEYIFTVPERLKVALAATTSDKMFEFKLKSFEIIGNT